MFTVREFQEGIVEKLGVDKSRRFAREADLIIYVVDGSTGLDDNDMDIISMINEGIQGKDAEKIRKFVENIRL